MIKERTEKHIEKKRQEKVIKKHRERRYGKSIKNMNLSISEREQVMQINLDALKKGKEDLIVVDEKTFDLFMDKLLKVEDYESCSLLRDKKAELIF